MKMIPLFRCTDLQRAVHFYTNILDFTLDEQASLTDPVVLLNNNGASLMLTTLPGDQKLGIAANVIVDKIDSLFQKYQQRGLTNDNKESPVHEAPIDQTWGTREFYITDPDGNTLRYISTSKQR